MQAIAGQKSCSIIKSKRVTISSIVKSKNIRKFTSQQFPMRVSSLSKLKLMCTNIRCGETIITRMLTVNMGRLQQDHQHVNAVGVVNRMLGAQNSQLINWHLESKANAVHGEKLSFPEYNNLGQQQNFPHQYDTITSFHGGLAQVDDSFTSQNLQAHRQQQQFSTIQNSISGAFGATGRPNANTMETSLSPLPLFQWTNYNMFMDAVEPWQSGTNNTNDTIGEQLNTPNPVNVCGFEYGSFGGLRTSEGKVNLTNVFSKNGSIAKSTGEDCNNNTNKHNNGITHGKREHPSELKCSKYDSSSCPLTPPHSGHKEAFVTAGFNNSWEFEPCLEEVILSPVSCINTPHHSTGVSSPISSSGDTERKPDEFETCVDFNTIIFSPSTIVDASEEDDFNIPLHEEIEQLSNSFYCKSNSLVSVNANSVGGVDILSPSFLKVLQEESVLSATTTTASNDISDGRPSSTASGAVFETQPSIANSFFSDDEQLDEKQRSITKEEQRYDLAVAAARPQAALQSVSSKDETPDVKTQTLLEHNYTIKVPFEGKSLTLQKDNTVKEANLSQVLKTREPLQSPLPKRPAHKLKQTVKRQLFQRKLTKMAEDNRNRQVPNLKLKIINPLEATASVRDDDTALLTTTQMVIHTPDLTNDLLDLEAEAMKKEDFDLLAYITSGTDYDVIAKSPVEEKPSIPLVDKCSTKAPVGPNKSTICAPTLKDLFNPGKRRLPTLTIENLDELTVSTNSKRFRSTASSTTSSMCGDNTSEASSSRPAKRRGRPPKPVSLVRDRSEYLHLSESDMRYREQRDKNNEASRKSRINRKDREVKLEDEARELNQQYEVLLSEEQQLIKECTRWRKAVMRLALL